MDNVHPVWAAAYGAAFANFINANGLGKSFDRARDYAVLIADVALREFRTTQFGES